LVGASINITAIVADRYGNRILDDDSTQFTITVSGSAIFTGSVEGSIIAGVNTNAVLIQVQSGGVTLVITDTIAETVTFDALDSMGTGLLFPQDQYNVEIEREMQFDPLTLDPMPMSFVFQDVCRPSSNGDLTFETQSDFGSDLEYIIVISEGGDWIVNYFDDSAISDCNLRTESNGIGLIYLDSFSADGEISFDVEISPQVDEFCANDNLDATLFYDCWKPEATFITP
jgi:hypothetical protein